jgi:hypothetical protein
MYACTGRLTHRQNGLVSRTNLGGYRCEVCKTVVEQRYDKKHEKLTA